MVATSSGHSSASHSGPASWLTDVWTGMSSDVLGAEEEDEDEDEPFVFPLTPSLNLMAFLEFSRMFTCTLPSPLEDVALLPFISLPLVPSFDRITLVLLLMMLL